MSNGDGNQPRGNDVAPIDDRGQLSPPIVRGPIYECARAAHVEGFVPHALVVVYANGVEVVGHSRPYVGYDDVPLTRPLAVGDRITATQQAFGLTSDQSYQAVNVDHQPASLGTPTVGPVVYACGEIVPVAGLTPSTHVEVYSAATSPVPVIPANLVGEADCTGSWVPVGTQPLKEGWYVAAHQVSCPGTSHEIQSPSSDSLLIPPEPHPVNPPTVDPPVVANDVVNLEGLYVGAGVTVTDVTQNQGVGGGLATADRNWAPVHPPIQGGHAYAATQKLCTGSVQSTPVPSTNELSAPVLISPICPDDRSVIVGSTIINATVVIYRVGTPIPIGIGGAVPGDLELAIGPAFSLGLNDELYVRQFMGNTISTASNHVWVGECRNVVTQHNDNSRSGAYLHETQLTPASVGSSRFGRLYEREVDGSPYAQVLYARDIPTAAGNVDLFIVATSTNMVYAFDADNYQSGGATGLVWSRSLGPTRMLNGNEICRETWGTVGVTATPVIDLTTQTVYVVARHWPGSTTPTPPGQSRLDGDNYLHALKLSDGSDRVAPVQIAGTDPRTNNTFDPRFQRNRPGLLLLNGVVYVGFGVFNCDQGPYHGWIFGYDAATLQPHAIFCTTAEMHGGGVWQSGNGLVGSDDGSVYFETGNEIERTGQDPPANFGDCFVRLSVVPRWPGLVDTGYFRPGDWKVLRDGDTDLGSGGPMLLLGGRLIGGGKQGRYYVLDAQSMHLTQDTTSPDLALVGEGFQAFVNQDRNVAADAAGNYAVYATGELYGPNIHGGPCYWRGPSYLYQMPEKDYLKAFYYDRLSGTVLQNPVLTATVRPGPGMPGGHSSLSADGDQDGIVWTSVATNDGMWAPTPGTLAAFNALTLEEIWVDLMPEWFAKFNPPTIADGKVFRPVFAQYQLPNPDNGAAPTMLAPGKVIVYGLAHRRPLPKPWRMWRRWWGGGDPAPRFTIEERWRMHGGSGALTDALGEEMELADSRGGRRRDFAGWVGTRRGRVSVGGDGGARRPRRDPR
jgi:hypothetical protein